MTRRLTIFIAAAAIAIAAAIFHHGTRRVAMAATTSTINPPQSGRIEINGISYYYEVHGTGAPLLLLHGGLGSIDMFRPILPQLTATRQVIAVDLQGHGRTTLGDREFDITAIADDLAALLDTLGYTRVDALGYSLGAGTAFRLAVQHPERVRRIALVSGSYSSDAFYPEIRAQQRQVNSAAAEFMKETPMYQSYMAVAPNPDDFPRLLDAIGAAMNKEFDWSGDVKELTVPTILVYGDSDMLRPEHMISFYQLLGGGLRDAGWMKEHQSPNRLAILPGRTHYDIFMAPELVPIVLPFLDGTGYGGSWEGQVAETSDGNR